MSINKQWLLNQFAKHNGITEDELNTACLAHNPNLTCQQIKAARKRLHFDSMIILRISYPKSRFVITDYGREKLALSR